jgi:hypothetical protein
MSSDIANRLLNADDLANVHPMESEAEAHILRVLENHEVIPAAATYSRDDAGGTVASPTTTEDLQVCLPP